MSLSGVERQLLRAGRLAVLGWLTSESYSDPEFGMPSSSFRVLTALLYRDSLSEIPSELELSVKLSAGLSSGDREELERLWLR